MNAQLIKDGLANMERLRRMVALAEEASPALKRRGERFRRNLAERQARNTAKILAHPGSRAYRDYIETPAYFGVPAPGTARIRTKGAARGKTAKGKARA